MTSFPNLLKFEIRKTAILIFFLTLFWTLDYIATSTIKATISDLCSCSCSCSWACVYVYIKAILQWNMNCCACVNFMLAFVLVLLVKTRLSNLSFHPSELSRRPEKIITGLSNYLLLTVERGEVCWRYCPSCPKANFTNMKVLFAWRNATWEAVKIRCEKKFKPASVIPKQCSTNRANKPTGSWSLCWFQINPLSDE